jgi:hypothetical protein
MRTRQFVALPAVRRDAEFPDDPNQDALASARAPLTFGRRLAFRLADNLNDGRTRR